MNVIIPKVFISYAWSNTERVIELAQRLKNDGVEVILDKWKLKEGQDKYAFMEQCVTDDTINKVLIICDKVYAEKANKREGGVGDEAMIMSAEIYGKVSQEKFIPVIFERDENGNEYTPAYLKSRIYIDLSNNEEYEDNYDRLLRNLYNKPEYSEPPLGKMPEWLNEETVSLTPIRALMKQIKVLDGKNQAKQSYLIKKLNDEFIRILNEFAPINNAEFDDNLLKQIDAAKPLRDLFLEYIEVLILNDVEIGDVLGDFFEQAYNGIYIYITKRRNTWCKQEFEFGFFMLWETFICSTAILLEYEKYAKLFSMLKRTYFLREQSTDQQLKPCSFIEFRSVHHYIEYHIKPQSKEPQLYTLAGDIVVKREKYPIITQQSMANADVVLYQLSCVYDFVQNLSGRYWFPTLYPYCDSHYSKQQIWSKMVSRKHCEKLYHLFGVTQLPQLVEQIQKNKDDRGMRYSGDFYGAPSILHSIDLEKMGTFP